MNSARRNAAMALGLMGVTVVGAVGWKPKTKLADSRAKVELEIIFPKQFGEWTVDDRQPVQLVSPDQAAVLNAIYNQVLSRTYVNRSTGDRIMLSVAYGGDQSDATRAHRPEVCYPAQGFQIISSSLASLNVAHHSLEVRQLTAKSGGRNEPITYWITVGERTVVSGNEQKLAQLRYTTRGIIPDGMLIRASSITADSSVGYVSQEKFISQLYVGIQPKFRSIVFGQENPR